MTSDFSAWEEELNFDDTPSSPYQLPEVKELQAKINEYEERLREAREEVAPIAEAKKYCEDRHRSLVEEREAELLKIVQQFKQDIDENYKWFNVLIEKMRKGKFLINTAEHEIARLQREMQELIDTWLLEQERKKDRDRFRGLMNDAPFKDYIFDFQFDGALFLGRTPKALLADEMGLGKTVQAAAAIHFTNPEYNKRVNNKEFLPDGGNPMTVLWICPNTLKMPTFREIRKWLGPDYPIVVIGGDPMMRDAQIDIARQLGAIFLVNYEALNSTPHLLTKTWPRVVMDEAHKFKSPDAKVFRNVERICLNKRTERVWCLTGTPLMNNKLELWSILHMLDPDKWFSRTRFERQYCYNPYSSNELLKEIKECVLRRDSKEVNLQLPELQEIWYDDIELEGEQLKVYDQMRTALVAWVEDYPDDKIPAKGALAQLNRLRQIALWPAGIKWTHVDQDTGIASEKRLQVLQSAKIDRAMDVLENLLEQNEKVVIYSAQFNEPLLEMARRLDEAGIEYAKVVGGMQKEIDGIVTGFNKPFEDDNGWNPKVLLCNMAVGAEGLNFQANCRNVFLLDRWWNNATNTQAIKRVHRYGQNRGVLVHKFQAQNTVDLFVDDLNAQKDRVIAGVVDREELRSAIRDGRI